MLYLPNKKGYTIKTTTTLLLTIFFFFTSLSFAELSPTCKKSIIKFSKITSLKDDALTVKASKETVRICIDTLPKDAVNEDMEIIGKVMRVGREAEKRYIIEE